MNINDIQLMSIGGNCASFAYLPEERNKGPVDNYQALKGILSAKALFDGTLVSEIYDTTPVIKDRKPSFEGDSDKEYDFINYAIVHANPYTDKYRETLEKRMENFYTFYRNVLDRSNYYFTYSLGWPETSKYKGNVKQEFYDGVEYLKSLKLFEKTIFIGTKNIKANNNWNFFFEKVPVIEGLKYVELYDINVYHHGESYGQMLKKLRDNV